MKWEEIRIPSLSWKNIAVCLVVIFAVVLFIYKLGSIVGGINILEFQSSNSGLGWHGLYSNPLFFPIKFIRSVTFYIFSTQNNYIIRLPSVIFGGLTVISFAILMKVWHDSRTALLATLLFISSAWVLHVSRIATYDVMYLWLIPSLLLSNVLIKKYKTNPYIFVSILALWGLMLLVPGAVWLVILNCYFLRNEILESIGNLQTWAHKTLAILVVLVWLPLLVLVFSGHGGVVAWAGLPTRFPGFIGFLKQLAYVPIDLFVRGPSSNLIWLKHAPVLDLFSLVACLVGIYYYAVHWRAPRSVMLGSFFALGFILVGIGGLASLSLLVPLLYVYIAMGIAYLAKQWLRVFPINPLARGVGLALIITAVSLSSIYNIRSYFVAWPHNTAVQAAFRINS